MSSRPTSGDPKNKTVVVEEVGHSSSSKSPVSKISIPPLKLSGQDVDMERDVKDEEDMIDINEEFRKSDMDMMTQA